MKKTYLTGLVSEMSLHRFLVADCLKVNLFYFNQMN